MVELAEIFRQAGPAYAEAYGDRMLPSHLRAMEDILRCRTPPLGGSLYQCDDCGHLEYAYHSCRNRHCPKCHYAPTERWLERFRSRLLPSPYAFLTFTLPAELRPLARSNQRLVYGILMHEAAAALQKIASDRRWVGGSLGILAVLHTWARDLSFHPHVHILATAGGLTSDGQAWIKPANPRFLLPGYALSQIFRAKVRDALKRTDLAERIDPQVWKIKWAVNVKKAGDGRRVAEYLSRYVYRVAITNSRIERFDNGRVTFRYVHSRTHEDRTLTLPVDRFLARFLQHVLPRGFHKIRYYGIFSPAAKKRYERARSLIDPDTKPIESEPSASHVQQHLPDHRRSQEPDTGAESRDSELLSPERRISQTPRTDSTGPAPEPSQSRRLCPVCQRGHLHLLARDPPTSRQRAPP